VVGGDGGRFVPFGTQVGEPWGAHWRWLGIRFSQRGRVAVSEQVVKLGTGNLDSLVLIKRVEKLEAKMSKIEKIIKI